MAFLMLLHEKMRLQRKVNKLTLQELRLSSRKERITKNIARVQKMYSSNISKLEKQAQIMQNQASIFFKNMAGVGAQNQLFNPSCYQNGTSGITTAAAQIMSTWDGQNYKYKTKDGEEKTITPDRAQELWQAYANGQLQPERDSNNNVVSGSYTLNGDPVDPQEFAALQNAMSMANSQVQQRSIWAETNSQQYTTNISVWLEAQKAQLEAQQDEALAPLEMKETEMDLDKESCEAQLADAKARLESIKQACSEGIKDSAPTFGLG